MISAMRWLCLAFFLIGCGGEEPPSTAREARPAEPEAPAPAPVSTLPSDVIGPYEEIHAALVAGRLEPVWQAAGTLDAAARRETENAPPDLAPHWLALAEAAARLREAPRDDASEARRGFGELSRHIVALVHANEDFGRGLSVYSCPSALGYPKWAQRGEMASPYAEQGSEPCGAPSDWSP
jgi:hypothetical protein